MDSVSPAIDTPYRDTVTVASALAPAYKAPPTVTEARAWYQRLGELASPGYDTSEFMRRIADTGGVSPRLGAMWDLQSTLAQMAKGSSQVLESPMKQTLPALDKTLQMMARVALESSSLGMSAEVAKTVDALTAIAANNAKEAAKLSAVYHPLVKEQIASLGEALTRGVFASPSLAGLPARFPAPAVHIPRPALPGRAGYLEDEYERTELGLYTPKRGPGRPFDTTDVKQGEFISALERFATQHGRPPTQRELTGLLPLLVSLDTIQRYASRWFGGWRGVKRYCQRIVIRMESR